MNLKKISLYQYRNIEFGELSPCDRINVIYGDNAQGKTNIIEAIWLFSGNNSFRGSRFQEVLRFGKDKTELKILFEDSKREQKADITLLNVNGVLQKKIKLNEVDVKKELGGSFFCVVFSPIHLSLINDGPKARRKFLDISISQINPQYRDYMITYEKLLQQRNALLKGDYKNKAEMLEVWDMQIAKVGTILYLYRKDCVKKLSSLCKKYYSGISSNKESFDLVYSSTIYNRENDPEKYEDEAIKCYYDKLREVIEFDIKNGSTSVGIHRDDLLIYVNELEVKTFGSQGQQRSAVITLKLSEAHLIKKATGENPIMLLDDVMSELDEQRQAFLLNHLSDMQVFITCCDVSNIKRLEKGKVFYVEGGKIVEQQQNMEGL